MFLYKLPSYLLSLTVWQILGVFSYVQAFALLESSLLWLTLVVLAAVLPANWYRSRFISQSLVVVFALAAWAIGVHFQILAVQTETAPNRNNLPAVWTMLWIVILVGGSLLAARKPSIAGLLVDIVERLTVIAGLYLIVACFAVVLLIVRTLTILIN